MSTKEDREDDRAKKRPVAEILPELRRLQEVMYPKAEELLRIIRLCPEIEELYADGFASIRSGFKRYNRWLDNLTRDATDQKMTIEALRERPPKKIPESNTRKGKK